MADIFISFRTDDTPRVQPVHDAFRARGLTVFWSNDIPKGAPNYQAILKEEIAKAPVVVVVWTNASVHSGPVIQECSQAERANKLFQILLDEIEPIDLPMEVKYKAQKTTLIGWTGDQRDREWLKLNEAIDAQVKSAHSGRIKVNTRIIHGAPDGLFEPGRGRTQWFQDLPEGPEMVVIPAGDFVMGGEADGQDVPWSDGRTLPQHPVTFAVPFAVGRFATTFHQWEAIYREDDSPAIMPAAPWGRGKMPVVNVAWEEACRFVACLSRITGMSYRLLSEAEWEFCCRAGTTTAYSFGASIAQDDARFEDQRPVPVNSFSPNAWGLYQMHGNVWEWCADRWHPNYEGAPRNGSAWVSGSSERRVVRGGSWANNRLLLRSLYRDSYSKGAEVGFRVARTLA